MADLGITRTPESGAEVATPPVERREKETRDRRPPRRRAPRRAEESARPLDLAAEVNRLNDLLGPAARIRFVRAVDQAFVHVLEPETGRILRSLPASEVRQISRKLSEGGILIDDRR